MTQKDFFSCFTLTATQTFANFSCEDIDKYNRYIAKLIIEDIDEDKIDEGFFGLGSNDGGLDFFYHDEENDKIYLFQFKSTNSYKLLNSFAEKDIDYLHNFETKIRIESWIGRKSESVKQCAEVIKNNPKAEIIKCFCYMGNLDERYFDLCYKYNIELYDWKKILELHNRSISLDEQDEYPDGEFYIECSEKTVWQNIKTTDHRSSYFGVIKGESICKLIERLGHRIFDSNLRYGLSKNNLKIKKEEGSDQIKTPNEGMTKTIKEDAKNFYYYNNGITITSKTSTLDKDETRFCSLFILAIGGRR